MYDPILKKLKRFLFNELGVASSCRIRVENNMEIIYVTKIKKYKNSHKLDGRGIIRIPLNYLLYKK